MAGGVGHPFGNFLLSLTDPGTFVGRRDWLERVSGSPERVRVLLGGRRFGKTSAMRAVEWTLLDPGFGGPIRALPVLINLHLEQPQSADHLRYLMLELLTDVVHRWRGIPDAPMHQMYQAFLTSRSGSNRGSAADVSILPLPVSERELSPADFRALLHQALEILAGEGFDGVCFLFDEAEYLVRQHWANDFCGYFRGLKEADLEARSFLGLVLAGYRGVRNYQQRLGSPLLNIAELEWLQALQPADTFALIARRETMSQVHLSDEERQWVWHLSGGHPLLVHLTLNRLFDERLAGGRTDRDSLVRLLLRQMDRDFSIWWNRGNDSAGLTEDERRVYRELLRTTTGTEAAIVHETGLSEDAVFTSLQVLMGTGVVQEVEGGHFAVGSGLFSEWVRQQEGVDRSHSGEPLLAATPSEGGVTPFRVFISYSHRDERLRERLGTHLAILERQKLITVWHDRKITASQDWAGEIDDRLNEADLILLLISPDFIASDYCFDKEMARAMERHGANEARVVPIILRQCHWQNAPFGEVQVLPRDGKPVRNARRMDDAFGAVTQEIARMLEEIRTEQNTV